ncbi:hypothetical protein [Thermoflavimicrobium daqui]|nr:hypothetical protein [Thermoflavimicrobium daqui]
MLLSSRLSIVRKKEYEGETEEHLQHMNKEAILTKLLHTWGFHK